MFAVTVTFHVREGRMPDFLPLMQDNARISLAMEAGCHYFDVCTDPERPDQVFLYELYTNSDAFQTHLASPHFKLFDERVTDMVVDKDVRLFRDVTQ